MTDHPNVALIRKMHEALARGNYLPTVMDLFSEDIVWHLPGAHPLSGEHRGRDAVLAAMRGFSGIQIEVHDVLANDEHAVALLRAKGERKGKRYDALEIDIYHIAKGKVAEFWSFSADQRLTDDFWS